MEHWIHTQLGNLVEVKSGIGFPKELQGKAKGSYPVYKVGDISKAFLMNNAFVDKAENYVSNEEVKILKGSIFREGSTVFAKIGEAVKLNRRGYISQPGLADNNVMAVIPLDNSLDRFIYFFLNTVDLSEAARSTTVPSIRKGDIENLIIPLPPLAEQHYLADKLDNLLARIQTLSDQLAAVPALLKQFRQSVLADAVSGKLTAEWRNDGEVDPDSENNIPQSWQRSTLGMAVNYGQCAKRNPAEIQDGEWVLELEDIERDSSKVIQVVRNAERKSKSQKNAFKEGDVLYGKLRPYLNKVVIAADNGVCSTEIIPIKSSKEVMGGYLFIWLKSPNFIDYVNAITYGVNMPRLGTQDGKKAPIHIPPIAEQTEIIRRVETLFSLADDIEQQSRAAAERVVLLTQSVLAKAFRGELSEQWRREHPDLISGDNSAAALLARIQAERAATGKKSRRA